MPNVALFGTSADPPTTGHERILNWLSWHFDWVAVWASDNPFKEHQTPLNHRMTMLELLIEDLQPPHRNVHVYPQLSCPRAIHTLQVAQRLWPQADFTFVIGSDLLEQLPFWHQVDILLQQTRLLVVPRPGYPLNEFVLEQLHQRGAEVTIADLIGLDISSTAYREGRTQKGIAPPIADYIHREHLYAWQDASREKQPIQ